jgi:Flp pilus assembly protein TadG
VITVRMTVHTDSDQQRSSFRKAAFGGGLHRRASVAITFAIASIPLILAVGAAVDYSIANRDKTALDSYADAAALSAVNRSALALDDATAKQTATNFFNAQATTLSGVNIAKVSVTVTDSGSGRTAVVAYKASVPTTFMGVADINDINIGGSSTAASGLPTYIDFYLLLDNTPSMGIGATPADVTTMVNHTPDQCGFACHTTQDPSSNYYAIAKQYGVTMRIDVVREAAQQLTDTATSMATVPNQFRMAIYDFGSDANNAGLSKVHPLSSDMSAAKSDAGDIDLMTIPYQNYNGDMQTDFDNVLYNMNKQISTPGDGTKKSPQKYLFFVTDGVADAYYPSTCSQPTSGGRCQEPINVANCTTMKNRGIKIAVLYTTYEPLPTNAWYVQWIQPFNAGPWGPSPNSKIATDLQSCASPGLYFEVSPTQGISDAMTALFQKAVAEARLAK